MQSRPQLVLTKNRTKVILAILPIVAALLAASNYIHVTGRDDSSATNSPNTVTGQNLETQASALNDSPGAIQNTQPISQSVTINSSTNTTVTQQVQHIEIQPKNLVLEMRLLAEFEPQPIKADWWYDIGNSSITMLPKTSDEITFQALEEKQLLPESGTDGIIIQKFVTAYDTSVNVDNLLSSLHKLHFNHLPFSFVPSTNIKLVKPKRLTMLLSLNGKTIWSSPEMQIISYSSSTPGTIDIYSVVSEKPSTPFH